MANPHKKKLTPDEKIFRDFLWNKVQYVLFDAENLIEYYTVSIEVSKKKYTPKKKQKEKKDDNDVKDILDFLFDD